MTEEALKKLRGYMGLCVRAGQAVFGMDGCLNSLRKGEAGVLLLDAAASEGTRKKYADVCRTAGVPLAELPEDLLEEATGRSGMAMAVKKGGLCGQILSLTAGKAEIS